MLQLIVMIGVGDGGCCEGGGCLTFAWPVNDERRMNQLVARGIDGLITDRFDVMRLLGEGGGPTA